MAARAAGLMGPAHEALHGLAGVGGGEERVPLVAPVALPEAAEVGAILAQDLLGLGQALAAGVVKVGRADDGA
jgi:hypothetical protein